MGINTFGWQLPSSNDDYHNLIAWIELNQVKEVVQ